MKYIKMFEAFSIDENSQTITFSDEEKQYIEGEIKSLKNKFFSKNPINLFEYYKNNNGFHIQCMPFDTKININPITIECEKEPDGKIYIQYAQESDSEDYGFTKFPEKADTLEDAIQEIKNFIQTSYN